MARRKRVYHKPELRDPKFDSPLVGRLISRVMIDGKRTHVLDIGQGPTVVMLHGASGNLRDFTFSLTDKLKNRYRIIAFDRPGLGYSEALSAAGDSPQEQARHLAKVLDAKRVRKALIVGHSFGGSVALTPRGIVGRIVGKLFEPDQTPNGYLEYVGVDLTLRTPVIRANTRQINNLKGHLQVMSVQYPSVRVPVEILHGEADDIVPASVHAQGMHALLPDSRLTLLPETGHMPHHAQPGATVATIDSAAKRSGLR